MKTYELIRKRRTFCTILDNGDWWCKVGQSEDSYIIKKENQHNFELQRIHTK